MTTTTETLIDSNVGTIEDVSNVSKDCSEESTVDYYTTVWGTTIQLRRPPMRNEVVESSDPNIHHDSTNSLDEEGKMQFEVAASIVNELEKLDHIEEKSTSSETQLIPTSSLWSPRDPVPGECPDDGLEPEPHTNDKGEVIGWTTTNHGDFGWKMRGK